MERQPAQFLVHATDASWRAGIKKDAVLVVNKARKPVDGSLVIVEHILKKAARYFAREHD